MDSEEWQSLKSQLQTLSHRVSESKDLELWALLLASELESVLTSMRTMTLQAHSQIWYNQIEPLRQEGRS